MGPKFQTAPIIGLVTHLTPLLTPGWLPWPQNMAELLTPII